MSGHYIITILITLAENLNLSLNLILKRMRSILNSRMQSIAIYFLTILITGAFKVGVGAALLAQPRQVHLSVGSQKMLSSLPVIKVVWCSEKLEGSQFVVYGITPDVDRKVKASKRDFHNQALFTGVMKNLKYDSKYYYRCGSDEEGWSQLYSFVTEPAPGMNNGFRVGVFGDTQNNTLNEELEKTKVIIGLLKDYSPDFTLHMGDIVENGSLTANWLKFLSVTETLSAFSPVMPVLGNHDVENQKGEDFQKPFDDFHDLFDLPGDELNYSFTYGNVRFIGLFSGAAQAAAEVDQVKYGLGSPEYRWLEKELSKAEKDKKNGFTVVFMHYPVHSFGWSNVAQWRESLSPLLIKYKADLCLAGHRHVYERHIPMNGSGDLLNKSLTVFSAGKGTIFVTNGSGGGNPTGPGGKDMPTMAFTPDEKMYNFAIMDIDSNSLTYRVFDHDNKLIDSFVIKK